MLEVLPACVTGRNEDISRIYLIRTRFIGTAVLSLLLKVFVFIAR